ncbi:KPN_02809 family neutral zinc metallopeptidase [Taibaiella koreensis]|uniref:KPN_02809 family neutral zinc metallopeptidase n=1 Tax=Taibaiella koreensis TaxID=1268548 RepID=UPI000E5A08CD|nr:neutral zinc metallopeptidase [Taibaiella koreensis]
MRWRGERESDNIEDGRGMSGGGKVAIGGGIGAIIVLVIGLLTGKDFSSLLNTSQDPSVTQSANNGPRAPRSDDSTAHFVSVVLASTEDVWSKIYRDNNMQYQQPKLRMFDEAVQSACGNASAAMGPFYCPADQKVYIDLSFCNELKERFRAPGNFAIAYVVAHEVGHHVQNLMGISEQVQRQRSRLSEADYNKLSVKLELQADFLAGVWAFHANQMRGILEPGDLESALTAANAIGDDKLQKEAQGYVVPDAFTHGTSQQRMYWFKRGFESGNLNLGRFQDIR